MILYGHLCATSDVTKFTSYDLMFIIIHSFISLLQQMSNAFAVT